MSCPSNKPSDTITAYAMSIATAVRWSGLSRATLYRHIASGRLPVRKCGARTLVLASDLAAFIESLPIIGGRQ